MSKKLLLLISTVVFTFMSNAVAVDFPWLPKLSTDVKVDLPGFEVDLAKRFDLPKVEVKSIVNTVTRISKDPADAYMVLRLSEISKKSPEVVIDTYRKNKRKGWGVIAKRLGIKPGSREFHALKRGHDLKGGSKKSSKKKWKKNKKDKKDKKNGEGRSGMGKKH